MRYADAAREDAVSRRKFVQGVAAGGVLAGLGSWGALQAGAAHAQRASELAGSEFDLTISAEPVNFTGRPGMATVVNGSLPAPALRWREGDTVTLRVRNELAEATSIHWHGILLPANMDGVPGLSFHGIEPGDSYTYRFRVRQSGTYWYHAHSAFQEQTGLYGPLIIEPKEPAPFTYDREHVVMLSDWTDRDPHDVYLLLKKRSDYFNFNKRTLGDFVRDSKNVGFNDALEERLAWGRMRMQPSDLADVSGRAYTYLTNGVTPAANWTGLFRRGERVRLRFINGSAMTTFDVRIPGLKMTVVAADGQYVHPVTVDEFRMAVAEVFDVIAEPTEAEVFTIFAQSMDRTGYARGTLAVQEGLDAAVPEVDEVVYLSMADMGHGGMNHGGGASGAAGHEAHGSAGASGAGAGVGAPQADHSAHAAPAAAAPGHAGHSARDPQPSADSGPADHAAHEPAPVAQPDHSAHAAATAPQTDHSAHDVAAMAPPDAAAPMQTHPASESHNPGVDMQTNTPTPRLNDPGVGLRDNGRRVLTYADLTSSFPDPDGREPERTIELHLTGHMERFMWSFDGVSFSGAEPIRLRYGERVRFVLVNDTMMEHPIHLHGMWSDLENEEGAFHARKHTVSIPPGTKRAFRVTADALGRWAFHCHLLFHMEAGMFREVRVEESGAPS
jgi:CopA family copper-resistance protein